MTTPARARLRELNDPLLAPLIDAEDDAAREAAIDALVAGFVKPLIDSMIARFRRNEPVLQPEDLEELTSIEVAVDVLLDVVGLEEQRQMPFAVERRLRQGEGTHRGNPIESPARRRYADSVLR